MLSLRKFFRARPARMAYRQTKVSPMPYSLNNRLFMTGFGAKSSSTNFSEERHESARCSSRTSAVGRSRAADMQAAATAEGRNFRKRDVFQKEAPSF